MVDKKYGQFLFFIIEIKAQKAGGVYIVEESKELKNE